MTISHAVNCLIVIACRTHVAETQGDPKPGPSDEPGWLERLESAGISLGASYTAEYTAVVSGGLSRGGSFRNLFSADARFDLGSLAGIDGAAALVRFQSVNPERGGSLDAGDLQVSSNIESDRHLDGISEFWFEQGWLDGALRIKAGKVDANSEFAFVEVAGGFSNSSAGFSPTVFAFPSYPDPATSVMIFLGLPADRGTSLTLGYGLFDGALGADGVRTGSRGPSTFFRDGLSNDWFHIAQGELVWEGGRLSAGGWWHTGSFDRFDGGTERGTGGAFATLEQTVWRSGGASSDAERRLSVFFQYGWADDAVSEVGQHVGGGLVMDGPIASRSADSAGLYASLADLSGAAGAGFERDELAIDLYYRAWLHDAVFVQPELQLIMHPGGDATVDDAWIVGFRAGIEF
ncbi:MAG: carbohydrate porin [Planctomycetota bacterium]